MNKDVKKAKVSAVERKLSLSAKKKKKAFEDTVVQALVVAGRQTSTSGSRMSYFLMYRWHANYSLITRVIWTKVPNASAD